MWSSMHRSCARARPASFLGTKSDLRNKSSSAVTPEEGRCAARMLGAAGYVECSATSGSGVRRAIEFAAAVAAEDKGRRKASIWTRMRRTSSFR